MLSGTRRGPVLAGLVVLGLLALGRGEARADFHNTIGKAGPFMFNLKFGGAIGVSGDPVTLNPHGYYFATSGDQFALALDFGFALDHDRNAYLVFPIQFQIGGCDRYVCTGYDLVMIPIGFQYDIPIRPVPGLYLYPRFSLGYAAQIVDIAAPIRERTIDLGFVMPEFGAKYVLFKRWNFGFEPFGLPIFFNKNVVFLNYRIMFYAGVNF